MKNGYERIKDLFLRGFKLITKNRKNLIITGVCIVLLGYGLYSILGKSTSTTTREISATVKRGDIKSSIKVIGTTELVSEQTLRFTQQGKITAVYVKAGDKVKEGQLIAELDKRSVKNRITQAELSLQNAKMELQDILKGSTNVELLQAQNNLDQAKSKLETMNEAYNNLVIEKNRFIANKDQYIGSVDTSNQKTINSIILDIKESLYNGKEIVGKLDTIFGVTDNYKNLNDDFEIYLSAKNSAYKSDTESKILNSYNYLKDLESFISTNEINMGTNKELLIQGLNIAKDLYNQLYDMLGIAYYAVENSVVSTTLSQSTIDSYKSNISTLRSQSQSKINNINSEINQTTNLDDIVNTETDYKQTLSSKEIELATKESEIANQKIMIQIYEDNLADVKKGATDIKIAMAENSVTNAELSLEITKDDLKNYELRAPFDGNVRKIDFKIGDNLTSDEQKYVYLENPNLVEITALLDQVDIVKVKNNQTTEIVFDSYPDYTITGYIENIDSTPEKTSGVTSYTVTIGLDKGNLEIYGGMSAKVYIIINEKKDILLVPNTYITEIGNKKMVNLSKNGTTKPQSISVGITDGSFTEVLGGLKEGDKLVKEITINNSSSSTKKSTSIMGGSFPGAGGGGAMRRPE